jgi:hypothetical protein
VSSSSSDGGADPDDSLDSLGGLWLHIEVATAAVFPILQQLSLTFSLQSRLKT